MYHTSVSRIERELGGLEECVYCCGQYMVQLQTGWRSGISPTGYGIVPSNLVRLGLASEGVQGRLWWGRRLIRNMAPIPKPKPEVFFSNTICSIFLNLESFSLCIFRFFFSQMLPKKSAGTEFLGYHFYSYRFFENWQKKYVFGWFVMRGIFT